MDIVNYVLNHPWLAALIVPPMLTGLPSMLGKLEKAAISRLLSTGDTVDRKLLKTVIKAVVVWAEEKGAQDGPSKFAAADKLVAGALPFLSADQREGLIEAAVAELDKDANDSLK